jgi:hypothetical protein
MQSRAIPLRHEHLTPEYLTELIGEMYPGTTVTTAEVVRIRSYGDADNATSASTSSQVSLRVKYGNGSPESLPDRVFGKMSVPDDVECTNPELGALFENEVTFYRRLRRELDIETPQVLGSRFDAQSGRFVIAMDDLASRAFHVNSMMDESDLAVVRSILDTYAALHAKFWGSPRFKSDLAWVQDQVDGPMESLFDRFIRPHVVHELARERYKQEFVEEAGTDEAELYFGEKALKRHYDTLPPTLLHGDAHFANTYRVPDGRGGIFDWQVSARGFCIFDVGYFLHTSLSVDMRRTHERELLAYYRDRLGSLGVAPLPEPETLWTEYRRCALHSFYLGWLTAPRENYGLEVCVLGNHRTKAAFIDLEARKLVREIM